MHKMFRLVMFCLGLPCLLGTPARAQQTLGSINGTVTDVSGGVLRKVTLKVHTAATNLEQTAGPKHDGSFLIVGLPLGKYSITFSPRGFKPDMHAENLVPDRATPPPPPSL